MLRILSPEGEERLVHPIDVKPFLEAGWQFAQGQSQSMVGIAKRIATETRSAVPTGEVVSPARAVEPMSVQSIKSAPAEQPTITVGRGIQAPPTSGPDSPSQSLPEREGVSIVLEEGATVSDATTVVANDRVKELETMHWRELEAIAKELNLTKLEGTSWVQMIPAIIEAENA